jgi:hypothetical protein
VIAAREAIDSHTKGRFVQPDSQLAELEHLKAKVATLEQQIAARQAGAVEWPPRHYYTTYHLLAGMVLGLIGALSSLVFNIIGAAMVGKYPLQLIRVYLTFPLGEKALDLGSDFTLAAGCCLYLMTGMVLGIPFHMILSRYFERSTTPVRFTAATLLSLAIWLLNYYGLIAWIQPRLIGGSWILEQIPIFVAVTTHLVFGWTMLLLESWGRFVPPAAVREARS